MKPSFCIPEIIWLVFFVMASHASPAQYWQQQANFTIEVSLNDVEHTLDAFEKIEYTNNSPDTLRFIWFHLWPNAYKNDKTAFSEQTLQNNTDFYFSRPEQKGYINRLNFEVNGSTARTEDHPQYIDVVKLLLPQPLLPHTTISITTPFHVKLPANFSRGGHTKQRYQVTQWYPKPAVYDRYGWHEMPYLDQGEFYSEFGDYQVSITLPDNYVVAATGTLQNREELEWLRKRAGFRPATISQPHKARQAPVQPEIPSSAATKTLLYRQSNVHDFAWFADKQFAVYQDTLQLASGRVIDVFSYFLPADVQYWKNSIRFIKDAVVTRSAWLGEYPYSTVSAVEAPMGVSGGMEYPTITCISPVKAENDLDITLAHEVSHNWLYGILATNERSYAWMDEGMNTYYDTRYRNIKYPENSAGKQDPFLARRLPADPENLLFETFAGLKKDQPVNTPSENFNRENYALVAYIKAGAWMKKLEEKIGRPLFDSCMQAYYRQWQFRHPYPEDFKAVMEQVSGTSLDALFHELDTKGSLTAKQPKPVTRLTPLFNLRQTDKYNYISVAPALGFNLYDGLMVGAVVHNFQLPLKPFDFLVAPLLATGSRKLNGLARASYSWYPDRSVYKITAGVAAAMFSISDFKPEEQDKLVLGVRKLAPYLRVTLHQDPLSRVEKYIQFKTFIIQEHQLQFSQLIAGADTSERVGSVAKSYVINQLKFVVNNYRVLYPYSGELQVEQQKDFVRAAFTGRYFFNYASGDGGLDLRFFAGKFFYTGSRTTLKELETDRFRLNLTGANGQEDYTYSNYFIGRGRFSGFASQQIMVRDGGFKVRTDLLSSKIGKTDNWLSAVNFSAAIPKKINPLQALPVHIPLKIFADVGTYAEAWDRNANTNRFLFDAGLQLSLLKETVNVYVPLAYSSVYKDYFTSTLGSKRFWKTISFSIDIQHLSWHTINRGIPL